MFIFYNKYCKFFAKIQQKFELPNIFFAKNADELHKRAVGHLFTDPDTTQKTPSTFG